MIKKKPLALFTHRLTKQGSLKDTTDCSPSNGYYFLPVYDKGDYILKISPPPGWSFEPEQISIAFDGKTDLCSLGKDVNFVFKVNFSINKYCYKLNILFFRVLV